jgi:hypothetical protein
MKFVDRINAVHAIAEQKQKLMGHQERDINTFLIKYFLKIPSIWVVPI